MMKLLLPFSITPDLEALSEKDWVFTSDLKVDTSFTPLDWNSFDESALEMSLKLSNQAEGSFCFYRYALTVGEMPCDRFLKTLAALKFDELFRVNPGDADLRFRPEVIARIIASFAQTYAHPDFILMGRQKQVGDNACTPLLTAELLGWPCVTQVIEIEPADEHRLRVTSAVDGGTAVQTISAPCVLSVGDAPCTYLRVPTLKDKMTYGKKAITVMKLEDFPEAEVLLSSPNAELCSLTPIHREREGVLIEADTPEEKAEILYRDYLKGRLERL
ncbi:electron transfer flavoprotein subunit beta/FixA family protein [Caproiciproducens faecalis]|nr:electron transfer flavoprotein subunit beta/FixA family protein [Caproiciproducens faecalis]